MATNERILQRTKEMVETSCHRPFSSEIALEIFSSQAVGLFRYSAALTDGPVHTRKRARKVRASRAGGVGGRTHSYIYIYIYIVILQYIYCIYIYPYIYRD